MRILRIPVFHEGTFQAIVAGARRAQACISYAGTLWEPVEQEGAFVLYCRTSFDPGLILERLAHYEYHLYRRLLHEHSGPDGMLRPHTHLIRGADGTYRPPGPRAQGFPVPFGHVEVLP